RLKFEDNLFTSDRLRWQRIQNMVLKNPDIRLAGPTWGWFDAAARSMAMEMSPAYAEGDLCRARGFRARDPDGERFHPRPLLEGVRRLRRGERGLSFLPRCCGGGAERSEAEG